MRTVRAVFRLLLSALWTLALVIYWLLGQLVARFSPRLTLRHRRGVVNLWGRGLLRIVGVRVRTEGTPPQPPFLMVSNHLSYLDTILLHSRLYIVFVSRADVSGWPVVGWLTRTFGTLFINRQRRRDVLRINEELKEVLDRGDAVVFFPEGTTYPGDRIYPFKASLLDLAAQTGLPVHYAAISYRTPPGEPPAHKAVCWAGAEEFAEHLWNLLKLSRIEATVTFGDEPVQAADRKTLARELEERVRARFTPVFTPEDAAATP